jgi:hypothetical protein
MKYPHHRFLFCFTDQNNIFLLQGVFLAHRGEDSAELDEFVATSMKALQKFVQAQKCTKGA